jgi:hypothetical protein
MIITGGLSNKNLKWWGWRIIRAGSDIRNRLLVRLTLGDGGE